jgi:hypothetical protein
LTDNEWLRVAILRKGDKLGGPQEEFTMKSITATIVCLALASAVLHGETFVGPTTATNRLLVPANSAIIITATYGNFTNSTEVVLGAGGAPLPQDYFAPLENGGTHALAGPAELIFTNTAVITYYQVTNSTIVTQFVGNDPIGLPIASNATMRIFNVSSPVGAIFSRPGGSTVNFTLEPNQPAEFTGPGTLSLYSGVLPPYGKFISYFIAQDGFTLPNQSAIAGPSGSYAVMVEKSFDMVTWSPVLFENTSSATQAFYRLRIQH